MVSPVQRDGRRWRLQHAPPLHGRRRKCTDRRDGYRSRRHEASLIKRENNIIDLSGADLRSAYLWKVDLKNADLRGADIKGADLSEADLSEADLRGSMLGGADLREADLSGANLREAKEWTEDQLTAAHLEGATMPNGQKYENWLKDREGSGEDG
jgi:uncharacterized protein YjbI with pentapeptide repeats